MLLYSIFDKKSITHSAPFTAKSDGDASRMVIMSMKEGRSSLAQFPEDYDLMRVADFDEESGMFQADFLRPKLVASLLALVPSAAGGQQ